jgi:hypothetical protein
MAELRVGAEETKLSLEHLCYRNYVERIQKEENFSKDTRSIERSSQRAELAQFEQQNMNQWYCPIT